MFYKCYPRRPSHFFCEFYPTITSYSYEFYPRKPRRKKYELYPKISTYVLHEFYPTITCYCLWICTTIPRYILWILTQNTKLCSMSFTLKYHSTFYEFYTRKPFNLLRILP